MDEAADGTIYGADIPFARLCGIEALEVVEGARACGWSWGRSTATTWASPMAASSAPSSTSPWARWPGSPPAGRW